MIDVRAYANVAVRSRPRLPIESIFGSSKGASKLPFPSTEPGVVYTFSGTAATYQAFKALGLGAGSLVLCPAYNCGHELEPLLRLGLKVECYRVSGNLEIDLEDIERRIGNGVRALIVTHYFGFAQPIAELRKLCDKHGVYLIEDCAHAFFSDNETADLGRVGDASIYSMRKLLPIPNGGAVIFNNPQLGIQEALREPPLMATWLKSLSLVTKHVFDRFTVKRSFSDLLLLLVLMPLFAAGRLARVVHPRSSVDCYDPDDEDYGFDDEIMGWSMSKFSQKLMSRLDWSKVVAKRQRNYRLLAEALRQKPGCRVLRPELPDYTCPLYFPLWVDRPDELRAVLAKHRIHAHPFWRQEHPAIDWARYPEARDLKRHVLTLPIHQDVDAGQLNRLISTLLAA